MVKKMAGIKNRGSQVHKVKTKFKRNKKVDLPPTENSDEKYLEKTLAHIPDHFGKNGVQLMEYEFSGDEIKNLLIKSFEKSGGKGLIKELEEHNYFIVFVDDSFPSNYSLFADINWCIWFWNNFDIEEYTFFVIEFPGEFKIYLHETSSSRRLYGKTRSLEIGVYKKDVNIEKIAERYHEMIKKFEKIVKDYMTNVFWEKLNVKLDEDDVCQQFFDAMEEGEFYEDFMGGGFFSFEGIDFPQKMTKDAYLKILKSDEDIEDVNGV